MRHRCICKLAYGSCTVTISHARALTFAYRLSVFIVVVVSFLFFFLFLFPGTWHLRCHSHIIHTLVSHRFFCIDEKFSPASVHYQPMPIYSLMDMSIIILNGCVWVCARLTHLGELYDAICVSKLTLNSLVIAWRQRIGSVYLYCFEER